MSLTDDSIPALEDVAIDPFEDIGGLSGEHAELRLACLREAREQSALVRQPRYADLLYRARLNARFVLLGQTKQLRLRPLADESNDEV